MTGSKWEKKGAKIGGNIGAIAHKVKEIISELNVEKKLLYTAVNKAPVAGTSTVTELLPLAQGLTINTREGNSVKVISMSGRISLYKAGADTAATLRVVIVQDNQQISDTADVITDVFQTDSVASLLNQSTIGRYKILLDKTYVQGTNGTPVSFFKFYKKMNHHVRYNGVNSTDIQKGGLYLLCMYDGAGSPGFICHIKTNYVDN